MVEGMSYGELIWKIHMKGVMNKDSDMGKEN